LGGGGEEGKVKKERGVHRDGGCKSKGGKEEEKALVGRWGGRETGGRREKRGADEEVGWVKWRE